MTSCPKQSSDNSQHVHSALLSSSAPSPKLTGLKQTVTLDLLTKDYHVFNEEKSLEHGSNCKEGSKRGEVSR